MVLQKLTLVLGGAASGKSDIAESLVQKAGGRRVYVATAQAFDTEMRDKIARHRAARGPGWHTIEAPHDPGSAISGLSDGDIVLIDCATLWLSNLLLAEADIDAETARLFAALEDCAAPVVIVSNEVGAGIVPENALARAFRDAAGLVNQTIAAASDELWLSVAGYPLKVK